MSQNLNSLLTRSESQENSFLSHSNFFDNVNNPKCVLNDQAYKEKFAKQCKVVNDYNDLTKMISSQDLFEYSIMGKKTIKTNFIRCLDFFREGRVLSDLIKF